MRPANASTGAGRDRSRRFRPPIHAPTRSGADTRARPTHALTRSGADARPGRPTRSHTVWSRRSSPTDPTRSRGAEQALTPGRPTRSHAVRSRRSRPADLRAQSVQNRRSSPAVPRAHAVVLEAAAQARFLPNSVNVNSSSRECVAGDHSRQSPAVRGGTNRPTLTQSLPSAIVFGVDPVRPHPHNPNIQRLRPGRNVSANILDLRSRGDRNRARDHPVPCPCPSRDCAPGPGGRPGPGTRAVLGHDDRRS
jgi:hypothetical protein